MLPKLCTIFSVLITVAETRMGLGSIHTCICRLLEIISMHVRHRFYKHLAERLVDSKITVFISTLQNASLTPNNPKEYMNYNVKYSIIIPFMKITILLMSGLIITIIIQNKYWNRYCLRTTMHVKNYTLLSLTSIQKS